MPFKFGGSRGGEEDPPSPARYVPPPLAVRPISAAQYLDTDTGKFVSTPTPCCGCRTFDHRFPLEMDEETSHVYREAKYKGFSYTFINAWCLMLVFATVASGGIIAVGFLDEKLIQYQVLGIVFTIIFGCTLPVFIVFWICVHRRARDIRRQYRAEKNRNQVFNQEPALPLGMSDKDPVKTAQKTPPPPPPPEVKKPEINSPPEAKTAGRNSPETPEIRDDLSLLMEFQ